MKVDHLESCTKMITLHTDLARYLFEIVDYTCCSKVWSTLHLTESVAILLNVRCRLYQSRSKVPHFALPLHVFKNCKTEVNVKLLAYSRIAIREFTAKFRTYVHFPGYGRLGQITIITSAHREKGYREAGCKERLHSRWKQVPCKMVKSVSGCIGRSAGSLRHSQ